MTALLADLRRVSATREDLAAVEVDWTGRHRGRALALALPATTDEVVAVLAVARDHGVGVTVRGGGTSLVAGAVPDGTVVLATSRLDRAGPVLDGTLTAGAGVTLAQVQDRARRAGWDYGVDLPSRASATVGGTVATDAGGPHVLAHGSSRDQVLGLEAVLLDGTVVRGLGGPLEGTAAQLPGSEGALAVITALRLRLVPLPRTAQAVLLTCGSVAEALALVDRAPALRAAELLLDDRVRLLLEAESGLEGATGDVQAPWAERDAHVEQVAAGHEADLAVPVGRLPELVAGLRELGVQRAWARAGTGALRAQVDGPAAERAALGLAVSLGGSAVGELGAGRLKQRPDQQADQQIERRNA